MNTSSRFKMEAVRSSAFGSIGASYTAIGIPLANSTNIAYVQNYTDAMLLFSIDGVLNNFYLASGDVIAIDIRSNSDIKNYGAAEGTTFYVKRYGVPTAGQVNVSTCY